MSHFGGMSVFAQKKMCDYQRSSEHVVTRRGSTGRSTVPYRCTIDVRTHTGPYGLAEPKQSGQIDSNLVQIARLVQIGNVNLAQCSLPD